MRVLKLVLLVFLVVSAGLFSGPPAAAPASTPFPSSGDYSWVADFDLTGETYAVLRLVTESGADDASAARLSLLAEKTAMLSQYFSSHYTGEHQIFLAEYTGDVAAYFSLLLRVRAGGNYAAEVQTAESLQNKMNPPSATGMGRYLPRLHRNLEHDARFALAACAMRAQRQAEQAAGVISLTVAGDTTFGEYPEVPPLRSFSKEFADRRGDLSFPLRQTAPFFQNDSLSVLNCEGTFTEATEMKEKRYRFKGPESYIAMFTNAGIEVVNLANNHTLDYLEQGYTDTRENLAAHGVAYYGEQEYLVREVEGIKFGFFGYDLFGKEPENMHALLERDFAAVRALGAQVIVPTFHWGYEYHNTPNPFQIKTARLAVDLGAELVIGHHPHVVQGIEVYKGKTILYSLGNFAFGGDEDLKDGGDTMLARLTFAKNGTSGAVIQPPFLIPANVSTVTDRSNYSPRPLFGAEADLLAARIVELSAGLEYGVREIDYFR